MKNIIIILLVIFASSDMFGQQAPNNTNDTEQNSSGGGTVGIRIGSGSSGKVDITSDDAAIAGYVIYDTSGNLVQSGAISSTYHALVDVDTLPTGPYNVVAVAESGEAVADTYFKE